ncbi:DUF308 domain-containing protein [Paracoccus sp. J56]|uniref:DUF308 domain-containing protein n=1 Tax=Paracoccus sp. J56 TaxID=935850 RepID=UPI00300CECB9
MADHWWVPLLRGIAAILFGLMALVWPGLTVYMLLLVFGAYAILTGSWRSSLPSVASLRTMAGGPGRWTGCCPLSSA